jgi:adenine-specific DNA-methyltransferase
MRIPLVLSYPTSGLLDCVNGSASKIAGEYFRSVHTLSFEANHSTMGASKGASTKPATENLYVCIP